MRFSTETVLVLLQLCFWSELGVLTRIYLGRLFNDGCGDGWGLCLTSQSTRDKQYGAEFVDLPANMLGCFFMGFLSAASSLGLRSRKNLAFLPAHSCLQNEKELLVGLRTGYCGSLTTFASWELSLLQLLIGSKSGDGGQWQQWLWGHIIGFELAYASHLIGEHASLGVHRWLVQEGPRDPNQETLSETCSLEQSRDTAEEAKQGTVESQQQPPVRQQQASDLEGCKHPRHSQQAGSISHEQKPMHTASAIHQVWVEVKQHLTTAVSALLCISLTILWVVLAIVDSDAKHSGRRQQWFALLLAPFGCVLRWLLSKLNTIERPLPWFPAGTFAANMVACSIVFILGGLTNRYNLGYWPMVILPAIRVGFAGALSTVSTFIAEVKHACVTTSLKLTSPSLLGVHNMLICPS
ncbi:hypothetical protein ABBQ38_004932 [Trebouxia sp. C0009 RCD-2024]